MFPDGNAAENALCLAASWCSYVRGPACDGSAEFHTYVMSCIVWSAPLGVSHHFTSVQTSNMLVIWALRK